MRFFKFKRLTPKLAYIIGVFLGDGSYDEWGCQYIQWSIDKEFVETVRQYCQEFLGPLPQIRIVKNPTGNNRKPMYILCFGCKMFGEWLVKVTDGKRKVPDFIPKIVCEETKRFIEGYLDSEGYISRSKQHIPIRPGSFSCGFEATDAKVACQIAELLRLFGVKVTKQKSYATKHKICYVFHINLESFYKAGFKWGIVRKQQRLEEYMSLKTSTETVCSVPSKEGNDTVRS